MEFRMKTERIGCVADDSERAQRALAELTRRYGVLDLTGKRGSADVIVVLGGDGFMLEMLHRFMERKTPIYGMNCGTIGFLLNDYSPDNLLERIHNARPATLHPLSMYARCLNGKETEALAINEVSLFRESRQAAKIRIIVDHVVRLPELIGDGIMVSSPAGSTAYNFSAGGPIIPLQGKLLALTPIAPFRPRRWRGALLDHQANVTFEILDPEKRPVSAVADFTEIRDVVSVNINEQRKISLTVLFDPEHNLDERIVKEQFVH
jgi:NAD+ kinase